MRIADVLRNKGGSVVTTNPDATVTELLAAAVAPEESFTVKATR